MLTEVTYERYFRAHYQEALGYACKKIPVFSDAEDLVMEAFASCYQKREQFNEEKASFRTWFFVVLGNKIKNYSVSLMVIRCASDMPDRYLTDMLCSMQSALISVL